MTSARHRSTQDRSTLAPGTGQGPAPAPVAGALPWVDGRELHPRLEALLHRVQAAERAAGGEHRRSTFRLMRELLRASVRLGVPASLLAECLGTSQGAVRARANSAADGTISAELIQQLTDLTPRQLNRLSNGELTRHGDQTDREVYPTTNVIRAVLKTPRPEPEH
jgi:hypothetical protein